MNVNTIHEVSFAVLIQTKSLPKLKPMINCFVVDDELHAVERLCSLIANTPGLALLGQETNPLAGLDRVIAVPPDLIFLDINMPDFSGIEFAEMVHHCTSIVFTTAHPHYAVEAFEKGAFDYLLKPISNERFLRCITNYKKQRTGTVSIVHEEYFYVVCDMKGKLIRIMTSEILYVEGALNYIIIHLRDGTQQITYLAIGEFFQRLPKNKFSRIHRSFVVNTDRVKLILGNCLTLEDGTILKIGGAFKDEFFERVNQKLIRYGD